MKLCGLSAPGLNGCTGVICGPRLANGRWPVQLSSRRVAVKDENLVRLASGAVREDFHAFVIDLRAKVWAWLLTTPKRVGCRYPDRFCSGGSCRFCCWVSRFNYPHRFAVDDTEKWFNPKTEKYGVRGVSLSSGLVGVRSTVSGADGFLAPKHALTLHEICDPEGVHMTLCCADFMGASAFKAFIRGNFRDRPPGAADFYFEQTFKPAEACEFVELE